MAKIKHTKNELKAQTESLKRYKRFLPMLLLKKQQLQAEIQRIDAQVEAKQAETAEVTGEFSKWIKIVSDAEVNIEEFVKLESLECEEGNIAGVPIPVLIDTQITRKEYDIFQTPSWVDEASETFEKLIQLRTEREIFEEQKRLITEELRTTSQRVNLFEKVKIPECQENIRVIRIFLGDEQTAGVVRGKIAKGRS